MKTQPKIKPAQFQARFLCPRFWGIWIGIGIARIMALLPYSAKLKLGKKLGHILYTFGHHRRNISQRNLQLAFPEKSQPEIEALNRQHFESLGIGLMETLMVWWRKDEAKKHVTIQGEAHLKAAQKEGKGVLILSPHFTHIEITGLFIATVIDYLPIYRPHDNPLMDYLIKKGRSITDEIHPIENSNTRAMIKALRSGNVLTILPDQKYTAKGHIEVPFFNHLAPSNPATSKLTKMTGCRVVPCFTRRDEQGHYTLTFHPALDNFPCGDDYQDTLRLHQLYESEIRQNIPQYLWVHDRWNLKHKPKDYLPPAQPQSNQHQNKK